MTQLILHFLFFLFFTGLSICNTEEVMVHQTFSEPHIETGVTDRDVTRLKEIDITNPIFVFK
jgi:hypothetical protein